jgi:hypothetical protein
MALQQDKSTKSSSNSANGYKPISSASDTLACIMHQAISFWMPAYTMMHIIAMMTSQQPTDHQDTVAQVLHPCMMHLLPPVIQ